MITFLPRNLTWGAESAVDVGVFAWLSELLPEDCEFCKDSKASSSFRFFRGPPIASRAVLFAARLRLSSSSSSCILSENKQ